MNTASTKETKPPHSPTITSNTPPLQKDPLTMSSLIRRILPAMVNSAAGNAELELFKGTPEETVTLNYWEQLLPYLHNQAAIDYATLQLHSTLTRHKRR